MAMGGLRQSDQDGPSKETWRMQIGQENTLLERASAEAPGPEGI